MIENIVRRLGEAGNQDQSARENTIRDAGREVARPVFFAVLIIILVYLPLLTLQGVEGKMFRPMALTVVFALVGSLILSLTLMPVLASLLFRGKIQEKEPRLIHWLKDRDPPCWTRRSQGLGIGWHPRGRSVRRLAGPGSIHGVGVHSPAG